MQSHKIGLSRLWQGALQILPEQDGIGILYVTDSKGSSPGRKGFTMVVSNTDMVGSIGGGAMEVRLVKEVRKKLTRPSYELLIKTLIHRKEEKEHRSGMICSGEQTVAYVIVPPDHIEYLKEVLLSGEHHITFNGTGFHSGEEIKETEDQTFPAISIPLNSFRKIHIIGGGHVGLALSEVMAYLGYTCIMYDNRDNLPTMKENPFINQAVIVPYNELRKTMNVDVTDALVVISFSYKDDLVILREIYYLS